jgi:hypothetical protein
VSPINPKDESEFDAISLIVEGPVIWCQCLNR